MPSAGRRPSPRQMLAYISARSYHPGRPGKAPERPRMAPVCPPGFTAPWPRPARSVAPVRPLALQARAPTWGVVPTHEDIAVFVRKREAKGRTYYAVVESYRDAGRVRHRQVVALGTCPDVPAAIKATQADVRKLHRRLARLPQAENTLPALVREREAKARRLALQERRLKTLADVRDRMPPVVPTE